MKWCLQWRTTRLKKAFDQNDFYFREIKRNSFTELWSEELRCWCVCVFFLLRDHIVIWGFKSVHFNFISIVCDVLYVFVTGHTLYRKFNKDTALWNNVSTYIRTCHLLVFLWLRPLGYLFSPVWCIEILIWRHKEKVVYHLRPFYVFQMCLCVCSLQLFISNSLKLINMCMCVCVCVIHVQT